MSKLEISAQKAIKCGLGQLGVLIPMSLPPYTYTMDFIEKFVEVGGDILFIPFMTPAVRMPWMMGGTEQQADILAYKQGITSDMNWEIIAKAREKYPEKPIIVVSFFNDIVGYGVERFAENCRKYQVDGLDTPGYSYVTSKDYIKYGQKLFEAGSGLIHPISTDLALAPEGTPEYNLLYDMICAGTGFLFIMTDAAGKSGGTGSIPVEKMKPATARIKEIQKKAGNIIPVITVCGIATPQNAEEAVIQVGTDGVMLASAVVRKILAGDSIDAIGEYLRSIKNAMKLR